MEAACAGVNDYLALRTFLAGHEVTAADVACWGQLQGTPLRPRDPKSQPDYYFRVDQ